MDGLLVKYPQFLDILNDLNVQPHNVLLQLNTIDFAPEPGTAGTACR